MIKSICRLVILLLLIVLGAMWGGLTLSLLWGWFVAPVFAAPIVGVWQSYGLALTYSALSFKNHKTDRQDNWETAVVKALLVPMFKCGLLVGMGWIVKEFFI